jgi:nucleoside 2-deoxyribosyltransferase
VETLRNAPPEKRALVCGWLWEQGRFGSVPTINETNVDALLSAAPLQFLEKEKRLLIHLVDQSQHFGKPIDLNSLRLEAMLETLDHRNVSFVAVTLGNQELLKYGQGWMVTGQGFKQADTWKQSSSSSDQCFVAMSFNDDLAGAWENGFRPAIERAGYKPLRIDQKHHLNKICDEIIAEIRRSKFVVADYTGHRGGVYYEAGYAAGRGLAVLPTCRKDDMHNLHFDVRQYNCIAWQTPKELADRLQARIEMMFGDGPYKRAASATTR